MSSLRTHRVPRVMHTRYAVTDMDGHVASGRAEETRSYSQEVRGGRANQTHTLTTTVFASGRTEPTFLFPEHLAP